MHYLVCERTPGPLDTTDDESVCMAVEVVGDRPLQIEASLEETLSSVVSVNRFV